MRSALIYNFLIEANIMASIAILLMIPLRKLFRKQLGNSAICFGWLLVAIRLLCPLSLPNPFIREIRPAFLSDETIRPIAGQIKVRLVDAIGDVGRLFWQAGNKEGYSRMQAAADGVDYNGYPQTIAWIILIGTACVLLWFGFSNIRFRKKLRAGRIEEISGGLKEMYLNMCKERKVRPVPVYFTDPVPGACLVGVFRPFIVLPVITAPEDVKNVLTHEICHLKNRDHIWNILRMLCCAIHWFNPLVYLMVREANANIELCCDVDVLQNADHTRRKEYVDSILMSMERCKGSMLGSTYFSHGGVSKMKERFENIYNIDKKRTGVILFAIIVIMSVILGTFVSCGAEVQAQGQDFALISSELTDKSDNYSDVRIIDKSNYSEDVTITDDGFYESSIKNVFISYDMSQALDDAKGSNSLLFVEILIDCQDIEDQWFKYNGKTLRKIKNAQVLLEYNKEFELWLSEKYPDLDEERKQNNHKIDNWEKHDIQEQFHKYWTKHHTDEEADKYVSAINELSQAKEAFLDWKKTKDYINVYNKEKKEQVNRMAKNGIDVRFINSKILGYLSYTDIASFHAENGVTYSISWATDFSEAWRK